MSLPVARHYAGVIIDQAHPLLDKIFHYSIPDEFENCVHPGMRVTVPFGQSNKQAIGYVFEINEHTDIAANRIKPIKAVPEKYPLLLPKFIPLVYWMKKEYHCLTIEAVHCFVPKLSKSMAQKPSVDEKLSNTFLINPNTMVLSDEQHNAVEIMENALLIGKGDFILEGVTGSGKTEVYIRLAQKAAELGKQSIILVPEISLTPQTVERFASRFGHQVAVLHSRMSPGERLQQWHRIRNRQAKIIVGARSAVFAPTQELGLIVIDEAHDDSYKSDMRPRYHTLDVARKRCEIEGGVFLLGSATPRLEDSHLAERGVYQRIEIARRVDNRPLPNVQIVDMRKEIEKGNRSIFSKSLYMSLEQVLARQEQAILLLNRRGYAQFVSCRSCGFVVRCCNCHISLTYHSVTGILKCHYCGSKRNYPAVCPSCGSKYIKHFGIGTQRVQEEVNSFFPNAKIIRMDMDTTSTKGSHQTILEAFKQGEYDFLLGTQMISKGLDFPNVTLVGVIAADTSLNLPDYRSGEKTFQLIAQVSGRTGRSAKGGKVIVQSYQPDHYAIEYASRHDYRGFYQKEIELRRAFNYPPFTHMVRILLTGEDEQSLLELSGSTASWLKQKISENEALSVGIIDIAVCPAPLEKINGKYRWQILIRIKPDNIFLDVCHHIIDECFKNLPEIKEKVIIDFYPVSLL